MEQRITDYVAGAAAEDSEVWAAVEDAPAFEPAVLPARLMPTLALAPVVIAAPPSPLFDPARSDRRSRRP
jgi:hypothetical protein